MAPTIAENLRRVMDEESVDANELARRLGYKNRATVDHWLSGRRAMTRDNALRAAEALRRPVRDLDPSSAAYTPAQRKTRAAQKKALQTSRTGTDTPGIAPKSPQPEAGVSMENGGLLDIPDAALFRQVLGVYLTLATHEERSQFIHYMRAFAPHSGTKAKKQPTVTTTPKRSGGRVLEACSRFEHRSGARRPIHSHDK